MDVLRGGVVCVNFHVGIGQIFCREKEVKEYTLLALLSTIAVLGIDRALGTKVTSKSVFWVFIAVMFGFKLLVNGYLTWRPIVLYGRTFLLGIRLLTIPVEDFFYGFSLITLSVVLWEYFAKAGLEHSAITGGQEE